FGLRVGNELIASSLKLTTMRGGLKELTEHLRAEGMAQVTAEIRKGEDPRLVCTGCFENKEYGSLVCSFTKGVLTGAIRGRSGGRPQLERLKQKAGTLGCAFAVRTRG